MKKLTVCLLFAMIPFFLTGCPGVIPDPIPIDGNGNGNGNGNGDPVPIDDLSCLIQFDGWYMSLWTPRQVEGIVLTTQNTIPLVHPSIQNIIPGFHMTDHWPVLNRDGTIAEIDGWFVVVGVTRPIMMPINQLPNQEVNVYQYVISQDGMNWQVGGILLDPRDPAVVGENLLGGSAIYDREINRLYVFSTAVMEDELMQINGQVPQAIALSFATPQPVEGGLNFIDWVHQGVILEPDGEFYARADQAITQVEPSGFRDPWFFRDPVTQEEYLLFTANLAQQQQIADGVVGLAVFEVIEVVENDQIVERPHWRLLPPILGALGVNQQLDRPHMVYLNNTYHLFFSSPQQTFVNDLQNIGVNGLYGFFAPNLWGPYQPMNQTGLVLANPVAAPLQQYPFLALPVLNNDLKVFSIVVDYLAGPNQAPFLFAGTPAPTMTIAVQNGQTTLIDIQEPRLPAPDEELVPEVRPPSELLIEDNNIGNNQ